MRKNPIEKSAEMRMTDFVEKEHNICELVKQMFNLFYFFFSISFKSAMQTETTVRCNFSPIRFTRV